MSGIIIMFVITMVVAGICFYLGFKIGRKSGDKIVADIERRRSEGEALLKEVKEAAEKGKDDLEAVGKKVGERWDKIKGESSNN